MFIAIVGTHFSGKATIQEYLINLKGFCLLRLIRSNDGNWEYEPRSGQNNSTPDLLHPTPSRGFRPVSFLMMNSPTTPSFSHFAPNSDSQSAKDEALVFHSQQDMLDYVTQNWRSNFVTTDLGTFDLLEMFKTRPFFMVVNVDAPILIRYQRGLRTHADLPLEQFVKEHDVHYYGQNLSDQDANPIIPLGHLHGLTDIQVINAFGTVTELYQHLDGLDITNPDRLRPSWDTYFMQLASLASLRSNCMKRRVGAILVRNRRILSTGYNGTPRGLTNCNEGGCTRCNSANETSDECVCLHAEENALLEAGRERVGDGAVLYCNTCPCLKCTIKIIQTGVKEVVYNLSYKVDDASAALFKEAGVDLRRHAPPPEI